MDIGITQLMVNDFVYDPNKHPAKIVCIKADNCSEYEPIPLTEEILRKNGWGDCCGQDCENCNFDTLDEVTWCKDKINDSDTAYFSEEAVRKLLRNEYASMNTLLRIATKKDDADVIEVEKSIETAITSERRLSRIMRSWHPAGCPWP